MLTAAFPGRRLGKPDDIGEVLGLLAPRYDEAGRPIGEKLREAAALWERLTQAAGVDARDAIWQHPDLLPDSEDLDDPAGFIDRVIGGDTSGMDEAIAEFERDTDSGDDSGQAATSTCCSGERWSGAVQVIIGVVLD